MIIGKIGNAVFTAFVFLIFIFGFSVARSDVYKDVDLPLNPPPNKGGYDTDPSKAAQVAWYYLTSRWKQCLTDFESDPSTFQVDLFQKFLTEQIVWIDCRVEENKNSLVDQYAHNGDIHTLDQLLNYGNAVTVFGTKTVALGANYYTDNTQTEQIAITIHEALHVLTKKSDPELALWLSNFGFKPSSNFASHEMTDWIAGACQPMNFDRSHLP